MSNFGKTVGYRVLVLYMSTVLRSLKLTGTFLLLLMLLQMDGDGKLLIIFSLDIFATKLPVSVIPNLAMMIFLFCLILRMVSLTLNLLINSFIKTSILSPLISPLTKFGNGKVQLG